MWIFCDRKPSIARPVRWIEAFSRAVSFLTRHHLVAAAEARRTVYFSFSSLHCFSFWSCLSKSLMKRSIMATMPWLSVDLYAGPHEQELGRAWSRRKDLDLEPPVYRQCQGVDSQVGKHRLSWERSSPVCCTASIAKVPCHHLRSGQYGDWRADFMGNLCGLEIQLRVGHCDLSFGQEAAGVVETLLLRQHPARGRACAPSGGPLRCRSRASCASSKPRC